jgi:hypothetical protein
VSLDHLYSTPVPDDVAALYISPIAAEVQRRREVREASIEAAPRFDVRGLLSPPQQAAWDYRGPVRTLLCGRRAGKTWWDAAWLLEAALTDAKSLSVYLALTQRSARHIVWPAIRDVVDALGLDPGCLHEHTLTVQLPNGSRIVCAGTDDVRTIETWRGTKLRRAVVDECGSQPNEWLGYLVRDVLRPALLDLRGELALTGTPGMVCDASSYWYQLTGPARDTSVPCFRWTALDNPHLPHAEAEIEAIKLENGWSDESPSYQREWMAEWVNDVGALVFPVELGRNTIDSLPKHSRLGGVLPTASWRYVIGVDVGVVDSTAIAVVASHPLDNREYVVAVEKHERMLVTQLRDRLRLLQAEYKHAPIVLDSGGMGKYHAEELTRQWGLHVAPAEKTEKRSHVRDIRDRLLAGRVLLLDGPCCDPLREEWAVLGWDDKRELPEGVDHASDAVLYALRRLRHYGERMAEPAKSQAELDREMEDAIIARRLGTARQTMNRAASLRAAVNRR